MFVVKHARMIRKERKRAKKAERDAKYRRKIYRQACEWAAKGPMAVLDYISPDPLPPIIHFLNRKQALRKAARQWKKYQKRSRFHCYMQRMKWIKIGYEVNDIVQNYYTTLIYHEMSCARVGMNPNRTDHVFAKRLEAKIKALMLNTGALRMDKKYLLWGVRTRFYHEGVKKIIRIPIYADILKWL